MCNLYVFKFSDFVVYLFLNIQKKKSKSSNSPFYVNAGIKIIIAIIIITVSTYIGIAYESNVILRTMCA